MNTSTKILSSALIAIASLSAASAFAGDNDYPGVQTNTLSNTTRAEVRAEAIQAKRDGDVMENNHDYPVAAVQETGSKTREQVKAELNAALRSGYSLRIDHNYPDAS